MFQSLYSLYKNNSNKTPLEDFNTECFAGLLSMFDEVKDDFIINFLNLPEDSYSIYTQYKRDLINYSNCIIDFVIEGKKNICFIENKVESKEGDEQLLRYSKVLDAHFKDYQKFLFYCTKYSEPKNLQREYDNYNFRQFKWFEIAKFLKRYENQNPTIKQYLQFLKKHKMQQDNTIKIDNLLAVQSLKKTIEIVEFHISNSKDEFNKRFYPKNYDRNFNWKQLKEHGRFSHYGENVLISESGKYSEILYSIEFETLELSIQTYVENNHEKYADFLNIDIQNSDFKLEEHKEYGAKIFKTKSLGDFLNDENSDKSIKEWFVESFDELINIIKLNKELGWNIN